MIRVLLLLALLSCATAPTRVPPPREAWPYCAAKCAAQGQPFGGVILPDPDVPIFACGCLEALAPIPQGWGPT